MTKAFVLLLAIGAATAAPAKDVEVKMLNHGAAGMMVFEPALVRLAPGDSVTFVPTDPGHNAVSLPTMTPPGGPAIATGFNQRATVTFTKEGLYGYKCVPHLTMGMVGLVQVGRPVNIAAVRAAVPALPPLARTRMAGLLDQAK